MSEHDYAGRLGLFWSWTESAGNNAAEVIWDGTIDAGAMLFGLAWSHYAHPSATVPVVQPGVPVVQPVMPPAPQSFVGRLFKGLQDILTLPFQIVSSPRETLNGIGNFSKNWLPQQVFSNSALLPLLKKYVFNPLRPMGVAFLRPFMERAIPSIYALFDASDLEFSLRGFLIPHKDNNPDALGILVGWTGVVVGNVIVAPYKLYKHMCYNIGTPKTAAEQLAPAAYKFGDAVAGFIGAPLGTFMNIIQATRNVAPSINEHGVKKTILLAYEGMTENLRALWSTAEPVREFISDITSTSLDTVSEKITKGIRNIPNMTVGELALYGAGTAAIAGLAYWKLHRRAGGAPLVVNNNAIHNHPAQVPQPLVVGGP